MQKLLALLLALAVTVLAAPAALEERANGIIVCPGDPGCPKKGPSGSVVSPSGGTQIGNNPIQEGRIHVTYKTVNTKQNNAQYFTTNIGLTLKNATASYPLGNLSPPKQAAGQNIDAYLTVPAGACGNFQLVVREQQAYAPYPRPPTILEFQSAAPSVSIRCCTLFDTDGVCKF